MFLSTKSNNCFMSLSTFIRDDLTSRILSGEIKDRDLTLESISERYEVSLTPVRSAVSELIESGILKKDDNRRLAISSRSQRKGKGKAATVEKTADVYSLVADHLVRLSLRSTVVFLREEATADEFEVSRSQMRNLFSRLAGEGLLEHIPRRGWRVRQFRREDLDAFKEVRVMLEVGALKSARMRLEEDQLQSFLAKNVVPKSRTTAVQIDNRIHAYIIEKSQNHYITDFFERHGRYYHLLAEWEKVDREEAIVAIEFHRVIIEALIERNWSEAETALTEHILRSHQKLNDVRLENLI